MKLEYRNQHGSRFAHDETREYLVRRSDRNGWVLKIRELIETAGVKHALGQPDIGTVYADTMREAKQIAQEYHDLGDDFRGRTTRLRQAQRNVDERILAELNADIARLRKELQS